MADRMPTRSNKRSRRRIKFLHGLPWYYLTRSLGATMVLYGLFVDKSDIRGEIILSGAGLAGFDKVSRSEGS